MINKIIRACKTVALKNRTVLMDETRRAKEGFVNLECYRRSGGGENLGDHLSLVVTSWMLEAKGLSLSTRIDGTKFLCSIGSVIAFDPNDVTVWGSGLLFDEAPWYLRPSIKKMDLRAVRGPRTRSVLLNRGFDCPQRYGDPAVLLPLIYKPNEVEKSRDYGLIKHYASNGEGDICIETSDYIAFVDSVVSCRKVVSSSLHGIIIAESYGIPAVLLNDGRETWDLFKYRDWYESTGRKTFPVAGSIEEALMSEPPVLPNLDMMRENLIMSFPYDLWNAR